MSQKSKKKGKSLAQALRKCKINTDLQCTKDGSALDNMFQPDRTKWPKQKLRVPVIFIHKPIDYSVLQWHIRNILTLGIRMFHPYVSKHYVRLMCPTLNDQKSILQYFDKKQLSYHTFGHPSKRKMKVVIRGLPETIALNKIKEELKALSIPIIRVHTMHIRKSEKHPPAPILAVVPLDEEGKKILKVKKILNIDVTLERPISKFQQCYRCQKWGHSQRYCHGVIKCVKCAGNHSYKKCERDSKTEPPKCANCGEEHTANYKKCSHYPNMETQKKKDKKRQEKKRTAVSKLRQILTLDEFNRTYVKAENFEI